MDGTVGDGHQFSASDIGLIDPTAKDYGVARLANGEIGDD